jgi:hypothetical protein
VDYDLDVAPTTGTGQPYSLAMGELWPGLARTLSRLEAIAGEPEALDRPDALDLLAGLQYRLHLGSEHVYGLEPPVGSETAHAEVAEAATWGADGVRALLNDWRGALFRVRLARLRLATPAPRSPATDEPERAGIALPLVAFLLASTGAVSFVAGATLDLWPLWSTGVAAVAASVLVYRP